MYYFSQYASPIGMLTLVCDEVNLVGVWMEGQKYFGYNILAQAVRKDDFPVLVKTKDWLNRYFAGKKPDIAELSLSPVGSEFRQRVWRLLCEIPYGTTTTYGELAKRMAAQMCKASMSAQAVGGAVGHNPISIIIPCHRVVGADGSMTGYAGGIEKKCKLLEIEGLINL
ncbi:MAG: methylated-DNA--[Lachnospiraceae bacterium]|nr:methylated-DNA--[protein]-cysteine S-methyltransferase [Lachnospiraceae bacterium]